MADASSFIQVDKYAARQIRRLGGDYIEARADRKFSIDDSIGRHDFDYTWLDLDSMWGEILYEILLELLRTHSVVYASKVSSYVSKLLKGEPFDQNTPVNLEQLSHTPEIIPPSYWAFIQPILKKWSARDECGSLVDDVKKFVDQPQKWDSGTNGAYWSLLVNDPEHGALTEQELLSVQDGLNEAFECGRISLQDYALVWLLIGTGVRSVQIARMTRDDVRIMDGPEGKEVLLYVPLAKGARVVQTEKWERRCPTVVAEVLVAYLDRYQAEPSQALFDEQSVKIAGRLKKVFSKIDTYSDRTNGHIHLTPYRFRYTLGTRAIAQGATDHEAARLLTHRTTFCVAYYRAAMPQLQKPIRDALSGEMEFLAKAFKGNVIDDLSQATRRDDLRALIRDFVRLTGDALGACGVSVNCHQHAPIACLSCRKFEPFIGAPWEELLEKLHTEIEREPEDRIKMIFLNAVTAVKEIIVERDIGLRGVTADA